MVNAIDYYDAIDADIVNQWFGGDTPRTATTRVVARMRPDPGARAESTAPDGRRITEIFDGDQLMQIDQTEGAFRTYPVAKQTVRDQLSDLVARFDPRSWRTASRAVRRTDGPVSLGSTRMLHPQDYALGLIDQGQTTINGQTEILGRAALQVTVLADRGDFDQARFWIDTQTGIVLKRQTFKGQRLLEEEVITRLEYTPDIDADAFRAEPPADFHQWPPP
jgi:outer membrane lipoprotein-sorting protein